MRLGVTKLSFLMIVLTIAPAIAVHYEVRDKCCIGACCNKQSPKKETKGENRGCNPFCNLLPIVKPDLTSPVITIVKTKFYVSNDNRILSKLSECWHPPKRFI